MKDNIIEAVELVRKGKVKDKGNDWYEVEGKNTVYNVYCHNSKISCECQHFVLRGVSINTMDTGTKQYFTGYLCKHIKAVIIYKALLVMKRELH